MNERYPNRNNLRHSVAIATGALLLTTLAACGSENEHTCTSPVAESRVYLGDPAATSDQSTWTTGVLIKMTLPADVKGVVVKYRHPHAPEWTDTSKAIDPDLAKEIALGIGNGDVQFGVATIANLGSAACNTTPNASFSEPEPWAELEQSAATQPNF